MLDINFIRKNPEKVSALFAKRGLTFDLGTFHRLDSERKMALSRVEELRSKVNSLSAAYYKTVAAGGDASAFMLTPDENADLATYSARLAVVDAELDSFLLTLPNMLSACVPDGVSESDNRVLREVGTIPVRDYTARDHVSLAAVRHGQLGLALDAAAGANLSGSRFTVMRGDIARLHRALVQYMMDTHTGSGYEETYVPYMVHPEAMRGTGQFPKFQDDAFGVSAGVGPGVAAQWVLIPTAEVPLTNMMGKSTFSYAGESLRFVAHTPCFRAEAGSAGRDVKGMIRQHQFDKVELVWFTTLEKSDADFDTLVSNAETILRGLELPYRVVQLCAGDTGFSAQRTIDLEVWLPGQNAYREISSCSQFGDFQARRMGAKYKKTGEKSQYWHTLNGSGLAVGRTLIAVLENYQTESGDVVVPNVLQKYMGCTRITL